jgi:integrase/recombinase XerD
VTQLRQKMLEELQRRNYSQSTARIYLHVVRDFAKYFHRSPDKLGPEQIRQYQAYLFQTRKLTAASVASHASALRFFFIKTLRRHFLSEFIPFPKCPKRLPTVLSPDEVSRLIDGARNLYHRTLLMTLYSTGMRRSELCHLKVEDIDSKRMMIRIHQGKGRRDRDIPLSPKLLETLRVYWRWMKPATFLFPGTVKGVHADVPITANVVWLACQHARALTVHISFLRTIDLRGLHRLMSEPQRKNRTIHTRLQKIHCRGVPQAVNSDAPFLQRGTDFGCRHAMLGQQILHAVEAETFALGAGKEHVALTPLRFSKPGFQHGECGLGKRCAAFFAALADHAQVSAGPTMRSARLSPVISDKRRPVCTATSRKA